MRDHQQPAALPKHATPGIMNQYHYDSGFNLVTMSSNTNSGKTVHIPITHSRQTSSCMQSTTSEVPTPTRFELIDTMQHISSWALNYSHVYYAIGSSYHLLPFSARQSDWVTPGMRSKTIEALIISDAHQLPDLVHLFGEIAHRLDIAQFTLQLPGRQWLSSEVQLRRCDMLLQEAELRLRFLQGAVGSMWFAVGRDAEITHEETERSAWARALLKKNWARVLPQMCFADGKSRMNPVERPYGWNGTW